ncbi:MAG TPA: glycosyltransferase family 4 protein [Armatimonadota bacterium]|nr:glycosyltransferase family 4 protein [Armatimonadota bacterium]
MSGRAIRIVLVIGCLRSGGAERQVSVMANYWARRGSVVHLLTLDDGIEPPFYALDPAVVHRPIGPGPLSNSFIERRLHAFGQKRQASSRARHSIFVALSLIQRIFALRTSIRECQADVVISFVEMTNVTVLMAAVGMGIPVIVSERTDPSQYQIGRFWAALRRLTYPRASHVVVQTAAALNYFPSHVRSLGRVIPNPTAVPRENVAGGDSGRVISTQRALMAMGRLDQNKSFDLLIRVFSVLAPKHPEWTLEIWGDGPLRESLETMVAQFGLQDRVRLPGTTKEPWQKMKCADLFVLSSRFEGFPNVLCEAMACGLPVISFDCPSGPSEIIRDGIDGVLVPAGDVDALEAAISRLMDHPEERERLAARAPEVLDRFGLGKVMAVWDELIDEVRTGCQYDDSSGTRTVTDHKV